VLAKVVVLLSGVHLLAMSGVALRILVPPNLAMIWHLLVRVLHLLHVYFLERSL
jgi:hypothetical protein